MKTIFWILVVCALGVVGYMAFKSEQAEAPVQSGEVQSSVQDGKKMPFDAFVKTDKGSYRCTVDQYLNDMDSEGVVYVSGGAIRGEFKTIAEGKTVETSFLIKGGYQYVWSPMLGSMGIKLRQETDASAAAGGTVPSGTYSWDASQIGEYDCQPWVKTDATFALPTNVTFTDASAI